MEVKLVSIMPTNKIRKSTSIWQMDIFGASTIPIAQLSVFCRKLSFLLDSGVQLKSALPIISQQVTDKFFTSTIDEIHNKIMQGESFSYGMEYVKAFPAFMCKYIAIGEKTSELPKVCNQLADYYEQQKKTKEELTAAMVYPITVTVTMLAVMVLAIVFVLPSYAQMFAATGVQLPWVTAALLGFSSFLVQNFVYTVLFLLAAAALIFSYLKTPGGSLIFAKFKLKIPIINQATNYRLTQIISLILSAGITIQAAIQMCEEIMDNPHVKKDLKNLQNSLYHGESFWQNLDKIPYIDPLLPSLARIGEETGDLAKTIEKCNAYFSENYHHNIRRLNKTIEPIITIIMGTILGFIVLAIILPTFQLATAI